jgi:hypothetical protein
METLPQEVMFLIVQHMTRSSVIAVRAVNKGWHRSVCNNNLSYAFAGAVGALPFLFRRMWLDCLYTQTKYRPMTTQQFSDCHICMYRMEQFHFRKKSAPDYQRQLFEYACTLCKEIVTRYPDEKDKVCNTISKLLGNPDRYYFNMSSDTTLHQRLVASCT